MKRIILWCALAVVFSCKENKTVALESNESTINDQEVVEVQDELELEIYNFNELDEAFLNTDDDKTYVVNFWATWCVPCVKELPYFEQLNKEYQDQNVEVLLVSLDFPKQYDSRLKPFIQDKKLASKVVALNDPDSNAWIPKVDENWSGAIPATIIYNKDSRKFFEKSFTFEELEQELKPFLN